MWLRFAAVFAVLVPACSLARQPIAPSDRDTGVPGFDAPMLDVPGLDAPGIDVPPTGEDVPVVEMDTPPGTDAPVIDPDVPADTPPARPDVPTITPDAGGPSGVGCGAVTCAAPDACCIAGDVAFCTPASECRGSTIRCDGPEDCSAGEICCGSGDRGGDFATVCQAAVEPCGIRVCHGSADCGGGNCCPIMGSGYCSPICF